MSNDQNPAVSVIVPARNEEACLALCLESLVSQTGMDFEIIVVDDASTDRTAEIAQSFAVRAAAELQDAEASTTGKGTSFTRADQGFTTDNDGPAVSRALTPQGGQTVSRNCLALSVVSASPLPENWTGKNNAMSAGAKIAKGKWLLFTDADSVHKPGSLARAVAEAEKHGAVLLSYSPEQEVRTFWEKAVMPVIFAELAATYPPDKVNDPSSPIAAANGQYLLISREAYDAVRGHTKIASDLLEDVAMARLMKSSGCKIFFRYGGDAVRTRMYRSWGQMKEGWTKNLALLFAEPTELAYRRFGEFLLLFAAPYSFLRITFSNPLQMPVPARWVGWYVLLMGTSFCIVSIITFVEFIARIRRAHSTWASTILCVPGLPIFAYLLLRSHRAYKQARFDWKDRSYIYTPEEVRNITQAPARERDSGGWRKVISWISNG
jgi:glycosyltransferase involved in cell wall biosynthesis